jgi:hypothetical protein
MRITIEALGEYPVPMPDDLRAALEAEIKRHMEGYGLTDVSTIVIAWRDGSNVRM